MIAGPMDYHLGGFRAADRNHFKPANVKPSVLGTRCQHLAMYVVYENPMPMVCDAPTAYEGQPGFDFIRQVPTAWDETRVLSGKVGEYIVVARRKGHDWYLGAMTGSPAASLAANGVSSIATAVLRAAAMAMLIAGIARLAAPARHDPCEPS